MNWDKTPQEHEFTSNVDMLDEWNLTGTGTFTSAPLHDEDFV